MLASVLKEEHIDRVISDNRFGLYSKATECIYITHQLHIMLPKGWRWLESLAERLHARIYTRFNKVWVPDHEGSAQSLAGQMSRIPSSFHFSSFSFQYIGPLSRFENSEYRNTGIPQPYDVVAVLSGLEPHRTLLEKEILARYQGTEDRVLIVQGLMNRPNTRIKRGNITVVPYMPDEQLVPALAGAKRIIARSGYSTIMDLDALGILDKSELIPTPGQPEQEYLAALFAEKNAKKC